MISEANSRYLEKWKDFPGPSIFKFAFALIGGLAWFELLNPDFKFVSHVLIDMFGSGNMILGVIAFSGILGVAACALLWFPSYIFCCIKAINRRP